MRYKSYIYIESILLSPYLIIRRFNKCTNRGHFLITRRIMSQLWWMENAIHSFMGGGDNSTRTHITELHFPIRSYNNVTRINSVP